MELASHVGQIILINLVLSGDNAVVIGMAAHPLPGRQRRLAITIGGTVAIALRVVLTGVAAVLLAQPTIKAIGGALLLWIAFKLLREEEATTEGVKMVSTLRDAIFTILLADVIMSLDNVLGVAAAAGGDLLLLLFGIIVSMAIVLFGGSLIAGLIDRLWWLAYLGSGVLAWTGAEMFLEDELVVQTNLVPSSSNVLINTLAALTIVALAHYFHRHRPRRIKRQALRRT